MEGMKSEGATEVAPSTRVAPFALPYLLASALPPRERGRFGAQHLLLLALARKPLALVGIWQLALGACSR
jgi:hypothetical protein